MIGRREKDGRTPKGAIKPGRNVRAGREEERKKCEEAGQKLQKRAEVDEMGGGRVEQNVERPEV